MAFARVQVTSEFKVFFSANIQAPRTLKVLVRRFAQCEEAELSKQGARYYHTTVAMLEMGNASVIICCDLIWFFFVVEWDNQLRETPVQQDLYAA